jgi:UMF1 family MFS transporter
VTPPVPDGGLFAAPAEKAYLALGFLIGLAAGPMQAASRTMLIASRRKTASRNASACSR